MTAERAGANPLSSRLAVRDLAREAFAGILARPMRTALTCLGTVLGVGALVATIGVAETAGAQIISRFDELAATEIQVTAVESTLDETSVVPFDAQVRLESLNGVVAAGTRTNLVLPDADIRSVRTVDPLGEDSIDLMVVSASDGLFAATRSELQTGRFFDAGHSERGDAVAVLGTVAARKLNLHRVDQRPVVFINDLPLTVIGLLSDSEREKDLAHAIIIPDGLARQAFNLGSPGSVHIDTDVGAAGVVASQAAFALSATSPESFEVLAASEPREVRATVEQDIQGLFLSLAALSLVIGAIGIANVTLVSVLERVGEIGLRRSLGATKVHIASQFLFESTAIGTIGGVVGSSVGVISVAAIAATRDWTPVLTPWLVLVAPLAGSATGLLAGTYPAWKAAATEPIAAMRTGA